MSISCQRGLKAKLLLQNISFEHVMVKFFLCLIILSSQNNNHSCVIEIYNCFHIQTNDIPKNQSKAKFWQDLTVTFDHKK